MCVLVPSTLCNISLYISFLYTFPYTIWHDKENRYSYQAASFEAHWLVQHWELPRSAWYKCGPRTHCSKLYHSAMTIRGKTLTNSPGFPDSNLLVLTSSMPFPFLFDLNIHAEYTLPQTWLLLIKMAIHKIYTSTSKRWIITL